MHHTSRYAAAIAAAMLVTVATQIFYITVVSGSEIDHILRPATWYTELFAFSAIALAAFVLSGRHTVGPLAWAAIALGAIVNLIQVAIGIAVFPPAMEAMEAVPQLFSAVLAGAFFFYFLGKILFGLAGLILGLALAGASSGGMKIVGYVAALSGVAAVVANFTAMIIGREGTEPAGAAGTLATALLAVVILALRKGLAHNQS